jgi:hypothetical protein
MKIKIFKFEQSGEHERIVNNFLDSLINARIVKIEHFIENQIQQDDRYRHRGSFITIITYKVD